MPMQNPAAYLLDGLTLTASLQRAKAKIDALNAWRLARAQTAHSQAFADVLAMLPLILHFNHPALPAFVSGAPNGIAAFEPDNLPAHSAMPSPTEFAFDGLYSMGSTGSLTQTDSSDLDLWLCHSAPFEAEAKRALEAKCQAIQRWARDLGVEVNLYLMMPSAFKQREIASLNAESSGSAQHFFLLDEFYRSAIRLAGKRLLWTHLNCDDAHYEALIHWGEACGELLRGDWIDFGGFQALSANEYFGASLWQLYKGIGAPYKSALKILLLESYSAHYPHTQLISQQMKKAWLGENEAEAREWRDPYWAMLRFVSHYLRESRSLERLKPLQSCVFLKANEGQCQPQWRRDLLAELINEAGFSAEEVALLQQHGQWKIKYAARHQAMLIGLLMSSYRNLVHFARKHQLDPSILPHDTDMMMRRLYSVFEMVPGKVQLISPRISRNLSEEAVTLVEIKEGSAMPAGWYLYNRAPRGRYEPTARFVQHQPSLIQLIVWGYANGIITAQTHLHLVSSRIDLARVRRCLRDLRAGFPLDAPALCQADLNHPNEIRHLVMMVNLTHDPSAAFSSWRPEPLCASRVINFGGAQQNLVGSVDIVYRNRWNEIRTHHFEGAHAILNTLKLVSNRLYSSKQSNEAVKIFCYSQYLSRELRDFIAELVQKTLCVRLGEIAEKQQRARLHLAGRTWQFVFVEQGIGLEEIAESEEGCALPNEVNQFACEGFLQFFFEDNADGSFNVYILDEKNRPERYLQCHGSKLNKIRAVSRTYHQQHTHRAALHDASFNFPQFYQVLNEPNGKRVVPFQSKQHLAYQQESVM